MQLPIFKRPTRSRIKYWLYGLFIALIAIAGALLYLSGRDENGSKDLESGSLFRNVVKQNVVKDSNCTVEDQVEYFHYLAPDPKDNQNNIFGLYIYAEVPEYFDLAAELVNSNGGDWGYVLIPFGMRDRDSAKWERVFEQLRELHLIPIIQLWDVDVEKFEKETTDAAKFLDGFIWPIQTRYISVYNEPNDSRFWYGKVAPEEYAYILSKTIKIFKERNADYFMINGAMNVSAATTVGSLNSFEYMYRMNQAQEGIFNKLDGWASHSYPQPNFSGSPYDTGRWSIKAYADELTYLKDYLGVTKDLPVFITETGWAHSEGKDYNGSFYNESKVADFFKIAYQEVWLKDPRVRAVTPFTIRYQDPHDHFSWVDEKEEPYAQFDAIKSLPKVAGNVPRVELKKVSLTKCD